MPVSRTAILTIGVSRRVLWVGAEAYPLQNIARAQTVRLDPAHSHAVWTFVKSLLLWVFLGAAGAVPLRYAPTLSTEDVDRLTGYIAFGVTALTVFSAVRLLVALSRRTLYALVIETAGTPRTAVVSPHWQLLNGLVNQIMAAISNPAVEFQQQVVNYYGSHVVNQQGADNIGMVNR
jgi:hypothetical protein